MRRCLIGLVMFPFLLLVLAACGSPSALTTPTAAPPATAATASGGTPVTPTTPGYPQYGHAPDYSWIAGKVVFTRIQGGCTYVFTNPPEVGENATPQRGATAAGPFVGTAVAASTSPPLRDITPVVSQPTPQPPGDRFVPGGPGWDRSVGDGTMVVLFGHLAGPGEPREVCPGGTTYIVDRWQANP
jgi:hypothetical protein